MIVTRYWLNVDGLGRVERIEWRQLDPTAFPSVTPQIPDEALVSDVEDGEQGAAVSWVALSQPAFTGTLEQGDDPYLKPLQAGAEVVDLDTWNSAVEAAAEEQAAAEQAERDVKRAAREVALTKLAALGLTETDIAALFGGA